MISFEVPPETLIGTLVPAAVFIVLVAAAIFWKAGYWEISITVGSRKDRGHHLARRRETQDE